MTQGPAPGVLFMGGLTRLDQTIFRPVITGLAESGYTRFVEPACGSLGFASLAAQCGFRNDQIEASDVTLFSAVIGAVVNGQRVDDLNITLSGFEDEDLGDPATVLYLQALMGAWSRSQRGPKAHGQIIKNVYWGNVFEQMVIDRQRHISELGEWVERFAERYRGLRYRSMDLFEHIAEVIDDEHIAEVIDDEHAVVALSPPWVAGDFERFIDPGGLFSWDAPNYSLFDPASGFEKIYDLFHSARCMFLLMTDSAFRNDEYPPFAVYGGHRKNKTDKGAVRSAHMLYMANRHEEALSHIGGKPLALLYQPSGTRNITPPPWPLLPADHPITRDSEVYLTQVSDDVAVYCRQLWTHRFAGSVSTSTMNLGLFIDGFFAGVCGLSVGTLGSVTGDAASYIQYLYGMPIQHRKDFRLHLLMHFMTLSRQTVHMVFPDYTAAMADKMISVDMSNYKYSKGYRAKIEVDGHDLRPTISIRKKDPFGGWSTHHHYPIVDSDPHDIFRAWFDRELKWQRNSEKQRKIREEKARETAPTN